MKKFLLLASFSAFFLGAKAQVNLDLETWSQGEPEGWFTLNLLGAAGAPLTVFEETADPAEGNSSAQLISRSCPTCPAIGAQVGVTLPDTLPGLMNQEFVVPDLDAAVPANFSFKFKSIPVGDDRGAVVIQGWKWENGQRNYVAQAGGQLNPSATWQTVSLPFNFQGGTPIGVDSLEILVASSAGGVFNNAPAIRDSSVLFIDDFQITYSSSVSSNLEAANSNIEVYPNPANNFLNFRFNNDDARTIDIYDLSGRLVNTTKVRNDFINLNVSELSNGMYIYQIRDNEGNQVKSDKFNVAH